MAQFTEISEKGRQEREQVQEQLVKARLKLEQEAREAEAQRQAAEQRWAQELEAEKARGSEAEAELRRVRSELGELTASKLAAMRTEGYMQKKGHVRQNWKRTMTSGRSARFCFLPGRSRKGR